MKKLAGIILGVSLVGAIALTAIGCGQAQASPSGKMMAPSDSQVPYVKIAEDFVLNSSTYKFDGIDGSLKTLTAMDAPDGTLDVTIRYQTRQPGHGDRTGLMLAQVITDHTAVVEVKDGKVTSAVCDGNHDMLSGTETAGDASGQTVPVGENVTGPAEDMAAK